MAITSGFFNSLEGDRKYDARQMGEMFDGLIMDGVFMSIGDALKTTPSSGMTVAVGTGRAWFLHTWTKNDSEYLIEVSAAESVLNRIDTIVLDVDNTEAVRSNTIKLIKGTPGSNAKRPTLINTTDHKQIPLADILVPAGATALTATNITNIVGTSECPYVTGPLSIIQNDDILAAWQEEFDTWFEGVKGSLDEDTAGNLYNLIMERVEKESIVDDGEELRVVTQTGLVAGALGVKELVNILQAERGINRFRGMIKDSTIDRSSKNIDFFLGSIAKPVTNNNAVLLATLSEFREWFQDNDLTIGQLFIFVMNGDAGAADVHMEGVSRLNNKWYVVFDKVLPNANVRINFMAFRSY